MVILRLRNKVLLRIFCFRFQGFRESGVSHLFFIALFSGSPTIVSRLCPFFRFPWLLDLIHASFSWDLFLTLHGISFLPRPWFTRTLSLFLTPLFFVAIGA